MIKKSLKSKILVAIVIISTFFSVVLGAFTFFYLDDLLTKEKINEIERLAVEQAHESARIIENEELFVKMLATGSDAEDFSATKSSVLKRKLLERLTRYANEDSNYLAIYFLNDRGTVLVSTDNRFVGEDYSFRNYFKGAMRGMPTVDVAIGKTSRQFGYYFAHPVKNKRGEVAGVMVVKTGSRRVDQAIATSKLSNESTTMLTDEYGVIVYSNKPDRQLKSLGALTSSEKQVLRGSNKFLGEDIAPIQYENVQTIVRGYTMPVTIKIYDATDGDEEILSVVKIHDFPFYLISEIGLQSVSEKVYSTTIILTLLIIIGFILMASVLYQSIALFLGPLKKLRMFSEKISTGDFSERVTVDTKDEFSDLADSFNSMASSLDALYKHLDDKVKERTDELNKSEAKLSKMLAESEKLNKFMVGREMEMVELKKKIAELEKQKQA